MEDPKEEDETQFLAKLEKLLQRCSKDNVTREDREKLCSALSTLLSVLTQDSKSKDIKLKRENTVSNISSSFISGLLDFILHDFKNKVLKSVHVTVQDPLLLAYFVLDNCEAVALLLENSFVHAAVHQLRCLQLFLKFNETHVNITLCLLGLLFCCISHSFEATSLQAFRFSLHHILPYYAKLNYVNIPILAKTLLACLNMYKRLPDMYLPYFSLDRHFSTVKGALNACLESGLSEVSVIDPNTSFPYKYGLSSLLTILHRLSSHPVNNEQFMDEEIFFMLQEFLSHGNTQVKKRAIKFLMGLCSSHKAAALVCSNYSHFMSKLEELSFSDDEKLQVRAASAAESILVAANDPKADPTAGLEQHHEDIMPLFQFCVQSIVSSLQSPTIQTIAFIYRPDIKEKMGLVITLLRLLYFIGEDEMATVLSGCHKNLLECLEITQYYTRWMFNGLLKDDGEGFLKVIPAHPLPIFHVFYYLLSHSYSFAHKLLLDGGTLHMLMDEIEAMSLLPTINKGNSWFLYICLATLTNCLCDVNITDALPSVIKAGPIKPLCLYEEFDMRFPAKILISLLATASNQHSKLLGFLDSEVKLLMTLLLQAAEKGNVAILSPIGSMISFSFNALIQISSALLKANPNNCLMIAINDDFLPTLCDLSSRSTEVRNQVIGLVNVVLTCLISEGSGEDAIAIYQSVFPESRPNNETVTNAKICEIEFLLANALISMKTVLSTENNDELDDDLKEQYQETSGLVSANDIAVKDRLSGELLEILLAVMTSKEGVDEFLSSTKEMESFFVIFSNFFKKCTLNLVLDQKKVPLRALLRLEYMLLICQHVCQFSDKFCLTLGEVGFTQCLDEAILSLAVCEFYATSQQVLMQLNDLCAHIMAICAHVDQFQGYLVHTKYTLSTLSRPSFKMWVKCALSALKEDSSDPEQYRFTDQEAQYLFHLMETAVDEESGIAHIWPLFSLRSGHSLLFLLKFCTKLVKCPANATSFLDRNILLILSQTVQNHSDDESLLQASFQLLERLATVPACKDKILEVHPELLTLLQVYSERFKVETFFSLQDLGVATPNNTGVPDSLLTVVNLMRSNEWSTTIEILQTLLKDSSSELKNQTMQLLGEASFNQYIGKRLDGKGFTASCSTDAKQAASCLGAAYDEGLLKDSSFYLMSYLDIALMDVIFNIPNKSHFRCLLCRQKSIKIIRSHVWPDSLLRMFIDSENVPQSKKIFDISWKGFGHLQGPSQIKFYMLCPKCEDICGQLENAFKNHFFSCLHNDPEKPSQLTSERVNIQLTGSKLDDWLYRFCLCFVFRVMLVAANGCFNLQGNFDQLYDMFNGCREILFSTRPLSEINYKPDIAIFITPTHFLSELNMSHSLMQIVRSKGIGLLSSFSLYYGNSSPSGQIDYVLCGIGDVIIVAGVSESSFKLIPPQCKVLPGATSFLIPSALERFLLFPYGLLREFESLATGQVTRALKAQVSSKSEWAQNELQLLSEALMAKPSSLSSDEKMVYINLLPSPFNNYRGRADVVTALLSSDKFKIVFHFFDHDKTLSELFLIKVSPATDQPLQLNAFIHFTMNNNSIWVSYHLSTNDLSIEEPLLHNKEKAPLPSLLENQFKIRELAADFVMKSLTKAGFSQIGHFIFWTISGIEALCDIKCKVPCSYCLCFCCLCFKNLEASFKVFVDDVTVPVTMVCSQECSDYIDINVEFVPDSTVNIHTDLIPTAIIQRRCVLVASTNGSMFGFFKSKFTIFVYEDEALESFAILCQARSAFRQKIILFAASYQFEFLRLLGESNEELTKHLKESALLPTLRDLYQGHRSLGLEGMTNEFNQLRV